MNKKNRLAKIFTFILLSCLFTKLIAADQNYGNSGEPISPKLVIGYDPYYIPSWSAAIIRAKKLFEKHLPRGSIVEFSAGSDQVTMAGLIEGKIHIAYLSDLQAIAATTRSEADLRIVGVLAFGSDLCNILVTRYNAPKFGDAKEAFKWLQGKQVAVPKGFCNDRFAQAIFQREKIEPSSYLDQSIASIAYGFRTNKIDAAVLWEPTASKLIQEGSARRVASGISIGENDAGFLVMRGDLIKQRPDIVKQWLQAELDAQLFIIEPKNSKVVASIVSQQTTGFSTKLLWFSFFAQRPSNEVGSNPRAIYYYTFTPEVTALITKGTSFLQSNKIIPNNKLRNDAVMAEYSEEVLKDRGLSTTAEIGEIQAKK